MITTVTDFRVLMRLAYAVGQAKKSNNPEELEKAEAAHDAYRDQCLAADQMSLGVRYGDLI